MKQKVLISVDTEGPAGTLPVERMIYGQTADGKEYGIRYLMRMFDEWHVKALFFVDVAEMVDHGEQKIAQVLRDIDAGGHDVGVHVHPDHMGDLERRYLWQYSKEEQYELIARCTDFYEKVLHRAPLSFRAGRYGANNDTLDVLDRLGYQYDMSEFYASRYCKITPEVTWNRVVRCGRQLKEVPVTTFRSLSTPFYSRNDQIDSGNVPSEFRRNIKRMVENGSVDVVSLFFHSFQLLNWRSHPDEPVFMPKMLKTVRKNVQMLLDTPEICFIAEKDLVDIEENMVDPIGKMDASKGIMPYYYFGLRAYETIKQRIILNV